MTLNDIGPSSNAFDIETATWRNENLLHRGLDRVPAGHPDVHPGR